MLKACAVLIFVSSLFLVVSTADNCPMKGCTCSEKTIVCSSMKTLRPLTNGFSNNGYTTLRIKESKDLKHIGGGVLPHNLVTVELWGFDELTLAYATFEGSVDTLRNLFAIFCKKIDFTTSLRLVNVLDSLRVFKSEVTDWDDPGLTKMGYSVKSVLLNKVGLTSWPDWIRRCYFLERLEIGTTSKLNIPEDAFLGLESNLVTVVISDQHLTGIPTAVTLLYNLKDLHLEKNEISNVHILEAKLEKLKLTLEYLHLGHNKLTEIPLLKPMQKLDSVFLSNNQISDFTSGSFPPSLTKLYLDSNKLQHMPNVIAELPNLEYLSLNGNSIALLQKTDFPPKSKLTGLRLEHNQITFIQNDAFEYLGQLEYLSLHSNPLSRIPLAIRSLENLFYLDLRFCENLECTCTEASVIDYFESKENFRLLGHCGEVEITRFFAESC